MSTGLSLTLYTSVAELENAKKGSSMILATKVKAGTVFNVQVSAPLEAVEFPNETDVRINIETMKRLRLGLSEELGTKMGEAMGAELQKVMKPLMEG